MANIADWKLTFNHVLIEPLEEGVGEKKTPSGLYLPETAKKDDLCWAVGVVHGVGPGILCVNQDNPKFGTYAECTVQVGDEVIFNKLAAHTIDVDFDDAPDGFFVVVSEADICLVKTPETPKPPKKLGA